MPLTAPFLVPKQASQLPTVSQMPCAYQPATELGLDRARSTSWLAALSVFLSVIGRYVPRSLGDALARSVLPKTTQTTHWLWQHLSSETSSPLLNLASPGQPAFVSLSHAAETGSGCRYYSFLCCFCFFFPFGQLPFPCSFRQGDGLWFATGIRAIPYCAKPVLDFWLWFVFHTAKACFSMFWGALESLSPISSADQSSFYRVPTVFPVPGFQCPVSRLHQQQQQQLRLLPSRAAP